MIVTSPNNPTSLTVPRNDLIRLCELLAARRIRLILDESFVEFGPPGQSLESVLEEFPSLLIIKSMSKVYGIAGQRTTPREQQPEHRLTFTRLNNSQQLMKSPMTSPLHFFQHSIPSFPVKIL